MYRILAKETLTPVTKLYVIEAPEVARKARAGQFIILRVDEKGERIPLTIAGVDQTRGTITLIFQEVGTTTCKLGRLKEGESILNLAGPLGNPLTIGNYGTVCIVVGGVGAAFVFWLAQAFKEAGNRLISILGARSAHLLILEKELKGLSDDFHLTTDDGSRGEKGLVTDVLARLLTEGKKIDYCLTAGPVPMMKKVS